MGWSRAIAIGHPRARTPAFDQRAECGMSAHVIMVLTMYRTAERASDPI
jgi:hypothetical protein